MKNKRIKIIIWAALLISVGMGAYFYFNRSSNTPIQVEALVAQKGEVTTTVTATGTVEPINQVDVGTQVSGEVEKLYVDFNSTVKKGQLIAEIDKVNLEATLLQAQASYESALNEKNYLEKIFNRQKALFAKNLISEADYDEAEYNYNNAKSAVTQRMSDLKQAKTNLSYAEIYSPVDGVVLSVEVDEGQTVAASYETPTLFTIAQDLTEMQVEADVDEADIGQVVEGQRVTFTVDAYPNESFNGEVTQVRLNPTTESNVVTYVVVIKADNPDLKLKPGLTATVTIYTKELKDVLTIQSKAVNFKPNMALLMQYEQENGLQQGPSEDANRPAGPPPGESENAPTEDDFTVVWVMKNKKLNPTQVELGTSDGVNVEVLKGISEGDSIVYSLKQVEEVAEANPEEGGSPFMPKPPGQRNKKK